MNRILFSSEYDSWETPQWLFNQLNDEFHFTIDVAASKNNHKVDRYYTLEDDGLMQDWSNEIAFCNPPYGKEQTGIWVEKSFKEYIYNNATVVMLIPSRTDTLWFHKYINNIAEIRFIKGRLKFGNSKNSAPFPSMIVIYDARKYHL